MSNLKSSVAQLESNQNKYRPGLGVVASVALTALGAGLTLPGPAGAPSAPGAVRISLEVREETPVTAQPAQLEDTPAGCADDATSFSEVKGRGGGA